MQPLFSRVIKEAPYTLLYSPLKITLVSSFFNVQYNLYTIKFICFIAAQFAGWLLYTATTAI